MRFYHETLGFKISDTSDLPDGPRVAGQPPHLTFLHVNPRHHSLALCTLMMAGKHMNHFMLEAASVDDVGRAYERAKKAGAHIMMDFGRHTNDQMLSFYVRTPSGWMVEYGWGGIRIDDDASWRITQHTHPNVWGHNFTPPPGLEPGA